MGGKKDEDMEMNKTQQAVDALQKMIELGELAPGSLVSERTLVEMTGFGRTPIREAIQRLAPSYLIRVHASKGIEIPAITVEDQLSGLEVRRAVEALAVELACLRADSSQRISIAALATRLSGHFSLPDYTETIRETHALIIEAAGNQYLGALMLPLQGLSRRFWIVHVRDEQSEIARGSALHQQILTAIADGDATAAVAASAALNDYLVAFSLAVLSKHALKPGGRKELTGPQVPHS
jgi:DNA-binding GntR family transcriptional regulator